MRAFPRRLLVLPFLATIALAAACGSSGPASSQSNSHNGKSGSSTTSPSTGTSSAPTTSIPTTSGLATLQTVKWTSVSAPGDVCPGRTAPVQLSHGKATIPAPHGVHAPTGLTVTEGSHVFGDLYGPGHDVAAVDIWCSGAHGSAADQLQNSWVLYTDAGGDVQAIATFVPQQPKAAHQKLHVPYFDDGPGGITIAPGTVTVKELWYTAKDKTCCPSEHVTTVWRAHGTSFSSYTNV